MTQRIPADARLGRTRTKQNIGYRILYLSREEYSPFTVDHVGETGIPGFYAVFGGVDAPDAGGYIVWGLEAEDIAEEDIKPAPADTSTVLMNRIQGLLETLRLSIRGMIPPPAPAPIVQMDTAPFETGLEETRVMVADLLNGSTLQVEERVSEIQTQLDALNAAIQHLDKLNQGAAEYDRMNVVAEQLNAFLVSPPAAMRLLNPGTPDVVLAKRLAGLQEEIGRLTQTVALVQETNTELQTANRNWETKHQGMIEAVDKFVATVGGNDDE